MTLLNNNTEVSTNNNRLSVQFSLTGLSFLVTNSSSGEVHFFLEKEFDYNHSPEELLLVLQTTFLDNTALQEKFSNVTAVFATNLYSLVPTSLFDPIKASEYLTLNAKILANDFIAFDTLENNDITIVYIPFVNINNYLFDRFGDFKYYHASTLLLKHILNKEKHAPKPKVYINITNNTFDFIALKNGELLLCNTFEFKTPQDFIYYVLFCLEQLKLNPDKINIIVSGTIVKGDVIYEILYTYIRNVSFINLEDVALNQNNNNLLLKLIK